MRLIARGVPLFCLRSLVDQFPHDFVSHQLRRAVIDFVPLHIRGAVSPRAYYQARFTRFVRRRFDLMRRNLGEGDAFATAQVKKCST